MLLTQNHEGLSGVAIAVTIEGIRPFLIETGVGQGGSLRYAATVGDRIRPAANEYVTCRFGKEGRVQIGTKRRFFQYCRRHVNDPAMDLAVISAILSSNMDMAIGGRNLGDWRGWAGRDTPDQSDRTTHS